MFLRERPKTQFGVLGVFVLVDKSASTIIGETAIFRQQSRQGPGPPELALRRFVVATQAYPAGRVLRRIARRDRRRNSSPCTVIAFPVGGTPQKVPRCVNLAATLLPSATISSSVHWISGKPPRHHLDDREVASRTAQRLGASRNMKYRVGRDEFLRKFLACSVDELQETPIASLLVSAVIVVSTLSLFFHDWRQTVVYTNYSPGLPCPRF